MDGADAAVRGYYLRYFPEWLPQESTVKAEVSEILLQRWNEDGFLVQIGMRSGVSGGRLPRYMVDNAEIIPT